MTLQFTDRDKVQRLHGRPKPESAVFVYPKKSEPFIFCSEDCAVLYGFNLTGADKITWKKITVYAYPSCDNCHREINRT